MPAPRAARDLPARGWHAVTALVAGGALLTQLVDVLGTGDRSTAVVRFASFYTVQANLLVAALAVLLVVDPRRDGRVFRVLSAGALVGITVTAVVYNGVLRPDASPASLGLTDGLLHVAAPALAVLGWAVFGPRPRVDVRSQVLALGWPALWLAWTLAHGARTGWWPYRFVDVDGVGLPAVLAAASAVGVLLLLLTVLLGVLDRRLPVPAG